MIVNQERQLIIKIIKKIEQTRISLFRAVIAARLTFYLEKIDR